MKIFDLENRLVSAVTPSSSVYYGYSGDGRRTYSYIDYNEVEYIYDGLTPLIERASLGSYLAAYTRLPGALGGIGGLISSHDGTNTIYYHDSNLGNVNQVTNSAGAVIQTYDYDAFGNITAQTGSLTAKYAYKTKEYSPETGLIFFGRRYYNPLIGRFITKDPLGQIDGPNLYLYCNNDPVNKYDPWGLKSGDSYPTQDEAGTAAVNDANGPSISNDKEYGGYVYKKSDGSYSYTEPKKGNQHGTGDLGTKPSTATADYHTHGAESGPDYDDENFSLTDKKDNEKSGLTGYLGTPSGKVLKYNPQKQKPTESGSEIGKKEWRICQ